MRVHNTGNSPTALHDMPDRIHVVCRETMRDDQWELERRECLGFVRMNQVTSASLRYTLSVFNQNSTLKCARAETRGSDVWVL